MRGLFKCDTPCATGTSHWGSISPQPYHVPPHCSFRTTGRSIVNGRGVVCFRAAFELPDLPDLPHQPLTPPITITWSFESTPWHTTTLGDPPSKRPRPPPSTVAGLQTVVSHIDTITHDSVFVCLVPTDVLTSDVRCPGYVTGVLAPRRRVVKWNAPLPVQLVRYAIHRHLAHTELPPELLLSGSTEPSPTAVTVTETAKKRAVLVGVSKYTRRRGDLEYCDEDKRGEVVLDRTHRSGGITTWYKYLTEMGYECRVFGDEFSPYVTGALEPGPPFFFCAAVTTGSPSRTDRPWARAQSGSSATQNPAHNPRGRRPDRTGPVLSKLVAPPGD